MKVLVTGSSGFIGSHLVRALVTSGNSVCGVDIMPPKSGMEGFSFKECDVLDVPKLQEILVQFSPDGDKHCPEYSGNIIPEISGIWNIRGNQRGMFPGASRRISFE